MPLATTENDIGTHAVKGIFSKQHVHLNPSWIMNTAGLSRMVDGASFERCTDMFRCYRAGTPMNCDSAELSGICHVLDVIRSATMCGKSETKINRPGYMSDNVHDIASFKKMVK